MGSPFFFLANGSAQNKVCKARSHRVIAVNPPQPAQQRRSLGTTVIG